MSTALALSVPTLADHSGSADSCKDGDSLVVDAWNEEPSGEVDGEYGCGGGTSSCVGSDGDCSDETGGAWFDDDSPVCRGDADHVRCTSVSDGGEIVIEDNPELTQASTFDGAMEDASILTGYTEIQSVSQIWMKETAFECIDGDCQVLDVSCTLGTCEVVY